MQAPRVAIRQYKRQQFIAGLTAGAVRRLWLQVGADFDSGWARVRGRAVETLQLGRAASVHAAMPYTSEVLVETSQVGVPSGMLQPAKFLEYAPNGMLVGDVLDFAPVRAKQAIAGGASVTQAQRNAVKWLTGVSLTMLADTRRDVYQADMIQRPQITGYVRMLNPPSCDRCAVLAGKRFLWNEGFQRHPNCDCQHIPASENVASDLRTDPYEYFKSLSEVDQDRLFGKVQAEAIRDGADIYRVVNTSQRGLGTVAGNARYGTPYKRTLEDIYGRDPSRHFVIENMRHHGYITGPQTAGGNILGNDPAKRILEAGRGQGSYSVGGQVVTTARASKYDAVVSGVRDPLNRATMTAAEKRLYDANYRFQWAQAGYRPNSVGANSADRGLGLRPITGAEVSSASANLFREIAVASDPAQSPDSVRVLASLLGLI